MANASEVARIEAALKNKGVKELEWSLWYCRMRQGIASARPADVKYWRAVEGQVSELLAPPVAAKVYPVKKKRVEEGWGWGLCLERNLSKVHTRVQSNKIENVVGERT